MNSETTANPALGPRTEPESRSTKVNLVNLAINAPPSTALHSVLRRWRARLVRTLVVLMSVCLGIALLMLALDGGTLRVKLTYSLCIGMSCVLVNDLSWFAQAWVYDRLRALRSLPPTPGPYREGWTGTLPSAALCVLVGPPLGQTLADSLFGFRSSSLLDLSSTNARVTLVVSLLATLVLIAIIGTAERLASARAEAEAARRLAAENQLRLLESQLEPHMLFNTLANLRVLITLDPPRAQAMLDQLIGFLRATLTASRVGLHPLAEEFARIGDYLALMQVRMGPRLQVVLDLPEALRSLPVPPLLLQPLVENSIRHGLEPQVAGGRLQVSASREGQQLCLRVRDTGMGLTGGSGPDGAGTHFGLEQVRARLAALHGAAASLTLQPASDADGGVLAEVRLPWPAA